MDWDARSAVPSYPRPVVLFDGVCRFCHWAVGFAIPRDRDAKLRFTPLQSAIGKRILDDQGTVDGTVDSVVLVDEEGCHVSWYDRSRGAGLMVDVAGGEFVFCYRPLGEFADDA